MDREEDINGEIKMSGEEMKEGNMMTDKKTGDRSRQRIISAAERAGRSIFRKVCQKRQRRQ